MRRTAGTLWAVAILSAILLLPSAAPAQQEGAATAPEPQEAAAAATTPSAPEGLVHTVVEGDTLWDLAAKHLGSPWKWTEIWERNRYVTNPHYIFPGNRIVIFPPSATMVTIQEEIPVPVPPPAAAEATPQEAPPVPVAAIPIKPVPKDPYLAISPGDFVSAGEFLREKPTGIGKIWGGRDPKVGFSEGDLVYLLLDKEIPAGQLLGVYRVRGPIRSSGERPQSGYVKFFIGILQVGRMDRDGQLNARVRHSFADITRDDLISEEIPSYSSVKIVPGEEGLEGTVITGRNGTEIMATGDFIYLDRGSDAGVALGNVFRMVTVTGYARGIPSIAGKRVRSDVAWAAVVRVSKEFSTAYVYKSIGGFGAGDPARRGIPPP
ncbi:MAG: peptidoglycan-binding protein LysM [Deltaproteobacteria bacterium]|nr:peptidoglycan-binding protein LysM [Deltaproteobacteria bacterium]